MISDTNINHFSYPTYLIRPGHLGVLGDFCDDTLIWFKINSNLGAKQGVPHISFNFTSVFWNLEEVFQPVCQHIVTVPVREFVFHLEKKELENKRVFIVTFFQSHRITFLFGIFGPISWPSTATNQSWKWILFDKFGILYKRGSGKVKIGNWNNLTRKY